MKYKIIMICPFILALYLTTWIEDPFGFIILWLAFAGVEGLAYAITEMMEVDEL